MSDISYYDEKIQQGLEELNELVIATKKASGEAQLKAVRKCQAMEKTVNGHFKDYRTELHILQSKHAYEEKLTDYDEQFADLKREIRVLVQKTERSSLVEGGEEKPDRSKWGNEEYADSIEMGAARNKEGLDTVIRDAVEARDLMTNVGAAMVDQTGQLNRAMDELDEMENTVVRAQMLIRAFGKRVFTDKLIRVFTFLLLVGVVTAVVLSIVMPSSTNFNVPDELKPPRPPQV